MRTKIQFRNLAFAGVIMMGTLLAGCADIFRDPLTDKKTGEEVTLLLMDRNFIKTKIDIHLQDMITQEPIENEDVEISFSGDDALNLIDFEGYKHTDFTTNTGYIEAGYDPNITISEQKPIQLTIMVNSPNYISAPQFISYTTEGIKDLVINMLHMNTLKSAKIAAYGEPFDLKYNGLLKSPNLVYMADFSSFPTGTAYQYMNMYATTSNAALLCNNLKDNVIYSDFGAYLYSKSAVSNVMPPALPSKDKTLAAGTIVYSTVLRSGMSKCEKGLTLHVERNNGGTGTGVFEYRITYSDGKTQTGKISCTFPSNNLIEQLYYPTANPAVKVELISDTQYSFSPAVSLNSPCDAKASFIATPKSNLKTFKMVTRYSCPESNVGMGLSIIGEYRKKGTTEAWTLFKFVEGVAELQVVPNADYDFRINLKGKYYYYYLPTDPSKVSSYLLNNTSPDFKFRNLTISANETSILLTTDVQFSGTVCDVIR